MLQKSGEVGLAILPDGTDMDVQTVSGGSSSSDYSEYIDDIDDVITVAILGQTATSGDAGGLSKGQAQENVRRDLVRSDAKLIMDAINRHLLAPMCRFRYGDGSVGAFEFRIDCDPSDDMERKATTVSTLAAAGYKPEPAWVAETFNMPLEEKSEVRDPGMPFSDLPLSSSDLAEEEFVSRLTRNALERMFASKTVINEFYGPLRKEIGKAFSDLSVDDPNLSSEFARRAESMFSRYPEIYEEMGAGSSGFQKVFSDAVLTAVAGKSIPLARAR
jgi:phage gp29-like protein